MNRFCGSVCLCADFVIASAAGKGEDEKGNYNMQIREGVSAARLSRLGLGVWWKRVEERLVFPHTPHTSPVRSVFRIINESKKSNCPIGMLHGVPVLSSFRCLRCIVARPRSNCHVALFNRKLPYTPFINGRLMRFNRHQSRG